MRRLLLALALAFSIPLEAANYQVSGTVVDSRSHAPMAFARVSLAPTTARDQKLEQTTKQDGRFSFTVAEPGKYVLQVVKPGYPPQAYKGTLSGASTAIVVRDDQDTSHIVFEAYHGSAITGQVVDEDSEPVGNALVTVLQSAVIGGERRIVPRSAVRTNAAGEFRAPNLPRGSYYICVVGRPWFADSIAIQNEIRFAHEGPPNPDQPPLPPFSPDPGLRGTAFQPTFYPNARTAESASTVKVDAGEEARISVTLPLARAVSVKGMLDASGVETGGLVILYKKAYDGNIPFQQVPLSKDGKFEFRYVPAGPYVIASASYSSSSSASWAMEQPLDVGTVDIEVSLKAPSMSSISGRVRFEGERPASGDLFVTLRSEHGDVMRTQVAPVMTFSLNRLPPGRYEVTAGNADYLAVYSTGPKGERLPLTLDLKPGDNPRDLTLTRAVSVIDGTVEKAGVPQIGAGVLLLPKAASYAAVRSDQTDSDGSYHLGTIPAGDYFLIAVPDRESIAYRDAKVAAALSKAAKPIHVEPGDRLNLKLDPVDPATLNLPAQ